MKHEPSTYTADIHFNYKQMVEVQKAVTSRMVHKVLHESDKNVYPDAHSQLEELNEIEKVLDKHIAQAVDDWEAGVARKEALQLHDNGAVEKFLSPGWCGLPQWYLDEPEISPED